MSRSSYVLRVGAIAIASGQGGAVPAAERTLFYDTADYERTSEHRALAREALDRLRRLGYSADRATSLATALRGISRQYARSTDVVRVLPYLGITELLEPLEYDPAGDLYEGIWLDLRKLAHDMPLAYAPSALRALHLSAVLETADPAAVVTLTTEPDCEWRGPLAPLDLAPLQRALRAIPVTSSAPSAPGGGSLPDLMESLKSREGIAASAYVRRRLARLETLLTTSQPTPVPPRRKDEGGTPRALSMRVPSFGSNPPASRLGSSPPGTSTVAPASSTPKPISSPPIIRPSVTPASPRATSNPPVQPTNGAVSLRHSHLADHLDQSETTRELVTQMLVKRDRVSEPPAPRISIQERRDDEDDTHVMVVKRDSAATLAELIEQEMFANEPHPPPPLDGPPLQARQLDTGSTERVQDLSSPEAIEQVVLPGQKPKNVHQARTLFTAWAREVAGALNGRFGEAMKTNSVGVDLLQRRLLERFPGGLPSTGADVAEFNKYAACFCEILTRVLGAYWVDIDSDDFTKWAMFVPPQTRVWPFARVVRFVVRRHAERDLVSYYLELEARALRIRPRAKS